jgi:hypothetical protein
MSTDVSEEHVTSIFRFEELAQQEIKMKQVAKRATYSSEVSVDSQRNTRRYIPEA